MTRYFSKKWIILLNVFMSIIVLFTGCSPKPLMEASPVTPVGSLVLSRNDTNESSGIQHIRVGASRENRPIYGLIMGEGTETILMVGSIHGEERAGTRLLLRLTDHLREFPNILQNRKIIMLPTANPDGASRYTRYNARGVDLNRNFQTLNWQHSAESGPQPLSEPESRAIIGLIHKFMPHRIINMHEPLGCIDYDGPGHAIAQHMAEFCELPVCKLGAKTGSLGTYAGVEQGIPIITFELPQHAKDMDTENLWQQYGFALVAFILHSTAAK